MVKKYFLNIFLILSLVSVIFGSGWHVADEVLSGNFTGNYDFDNVPTVDGTEVQLRVGSSCAVGSAIRSINSDGTVVCETDDNTGITSESDPVFCLPLQL